MFKNFLHNKYWMMIPVLAWAILAPSLSYAEVTIMKDAAARGLVGPDGSRAVSLSVAQCEGALRSIRYAGRGDPEPVFTDSQVQALAPHIQKALAKIQSGKAVAFHQGRVIGAVFFSKNTLYWHFTHIQNRTPFQLTPIAEEANRLSDIVGKLSADDIEISHWKLVPQQGQSLHRGRPDMLAMSVSGLPTTAASSAPAAAVAVATGATSHDAETRIDTLSRLLDKGLITKDEYRGKLETILSEYDARNPSPEAGLEFLQRLDKKGQIAPDLLQKQRKKLLDRL
ncbi:MAG: SHOCT domain-containing protein [Mariprofundaceae bacterium]|nr:SHOCT domain-containing protein [Mariprofundaceae bacterium]